MPHSSVQFIYLLLFISEPFVLPFSAPKHEYRMYHLKRNQQQPLSTTQKFNYMLAHRHVIGSPVLLHDSRVKVILVARPPHYLGKRREVLTWCNHEKNVWLFLIVTLRGLCWSGLWRTCAERLRRSREYASWKIFQRKFMVMCWEMDHVFSRFQLCRVH